MLSSQSDMEPRVVEVPLLYKGPWRPRSVIWRKPVPRRRETFLAESTLGSVYEVCVIVSSPCPDWASWASQTVYMEKIGRARRVTIPSQKVDLAFSPSQLFVSRKRFSTFSKGGV